MRVVVSGQVAEAPPLDAGTLVRVGVGLGGSHVCLLSTSSSDRAQVAGGYAVAGTANFADSGTGVLDSGMGSRCTGIGYSLGGSSGDLFTRPDAISRVLRTR